MYLFTFKYTNGQENSWYFNTVKEGIDFAYREGDHLLEYHYVMIDKEDPEFW